MNYLAHAYLSFGEPEITVGNMISDFVKGSKKFNYPARVQNGIALHRSIDQFTDCHKATIAAKQFFRPVYRLYAGAFIDIVYDHFLATDETIFSGEYPLSAFSAETYRVLYAFESILPENFKLILPFMKSHDWLYHYQFNEGIRRSFAGLVRRSKYMDDYDSAFLLFRENYKDLKQYYQAFFPELKDFAFQNLQLMQTK
jgi:acyl carrier protein phosphodiesterase